MAKQLPPNIRINNGSLSFQKRIPKSVITHPYWNGRQFFTKQLGLPENAFYDDVQKSRAGALEEFSQLCAALNSKDVDELPDAELMRHGKVLLESLGYQVGQAREELRDPSKTINEDSATASQVWFDHEFLNNPIWTELLDWKNHCRLLEEQSEERGDPFFYKPPVPVHLRVIDAA